MEFLKAWIDPVAFGALGLMSILMLAAAIERWRFFRQVDLSAFDNVHSLNVALTDRMTTIYTVGATAPYVGLLGTVVGILIVFYDLGQSGDIAVSTIMVGLALALKVTAAGLLVAIPATMIHNVLARRAEVLVEQWRARQARGGPSGERSG
ncbi:MAG: TonB-system energizer ExbB [Halothiobacillaceae bacterium]